MKWIKESVLNELSKNISEVSIYLADFLSQLDNIFSEISSILCVKYSCAECPLYSIPKCTITKLAILLNNAELSKKEGEIKND